jgi:hypothetical protein
VKTAAKSRKRGMKPTSSPDALFKATVGKLLRTPPKAHSDMGAHNNSHADKGQATDGPTKASGKS